VSERTLRVTWAWLWTFLAGCLLASGAVAVAVIALSGRDSGEVALAVLLIGFPALLGAFALGTIALVMARPSGKGWRALRRWSLALLGCVALIIGLVTLGEGARGSLPLIVAGLTAIAFLALDLRRGRGE
jgi:peptidoglycan/LPS O-acetylase OafA/YrhL